MQISNNMPIIFLINGILHAFTIARFNTCDLQCIYVDLMFLFRIIVYAPFTLTDIFPAPSYHCPLKISRFNSALVSVSIIKLAIISTLTLSHSMKEINFSVIHLGELFLIRATFYIIK